MWHDSFIHVTWLIHTHDTTHSREWYDSFIRGTWLIHTCDVTHPYSTQLNKMHDDSHPCFWNLRLVAAEFFEEERTDDFEVTAACVEVQRRGSGRGGRWIFVLMDIPWAHLTDNRGEIKSPILCQKSPIFYILEYRALLAENRAFWTHLNQRLQSSGKNRSPPSRSLSNLQICWCCLRLWRAWHVSAIVCTQENLFSFRRTRTWVGGCGACVYMYICA